MKLFEENWAKPAKVTVLGGLGLLILCLCLSAWAQTAPVLAIVPATNNSVTVTVTNGTGTSKYQIYWTEFLDEDLDWQLLTNGSAGVTNFTFNMNDTTMGFFMGALNTNSTPFVLYLTVQTPVNGGNIQ